MRILLTLQSEPRRVHLQPPSCYHLQVKSVRLLWNVHDYVIKQTAHQAEQECDEGWHWNHFSASTSGCKFFYAISVPLWGHKYVDTPNYGLFLMASLFKLKEILKLQRTKTFQPIMCFQLCIICVCPTPWRNSFPSLVWKNLTGLRRVLTSTTSTSHTCGLGHWLRARPDHSASVLDHTNAKWVQIPAARLQRLLEAVTAAD